MTVQFLRNYELGVTTKQGNPRLIKDLRIQFEVIKSVQKTPNTAKIVIINPNRRTVDALSEEGTDINLNVGYGSELSLIFKGTVKNLLHGATGNERNVTIYSRDGIRDWETSKVNKTFEPSISPDDILSEVLKSFKGLFVESKDPLPKSSDNLRGVSYSGMAKDVLDQVLERFDFSWHIQDGGVIIRDNAIERNQESAIEIASNTGMIGSPTVTEIGADVTTLLNPKLLPDKVFSISSTGANVSFGNLFHRDVKRTSAEGYYEVREVSFKGDSREGDWISSVTGKTINV